MKRFPDSLSGAFGRADREFVYRVQSTLEKLKQQEDKKVKRKLSLGLILAIILALLATGTALALTVGGWGHIEKAMDLAVESGVYGEWSLEAKLKLIDAMRADGIGIRDGDWEKLHGQDLTEEEKHALADGILTAYYGDEKYLYYYTIAEAEWGDPHTWSLEQKHWFWEKLREKGLYGDDAWIDVLPEEGDLAPEEAVRIARQAVKDAYLLTDAEIEGYYPNVSFFITDGCKTPRWMIEFMSRYGNSGEFASRYSVLLTREGEVTEDAAEGWLTPAHARIREEQQKGTAVDMSALLGQMRFADQDTVYWQPEGGKHYHFLPDCPMVKKDFLPLRALPVSDPQIGRLTPCPCCVEQQDFWTLKDKLRYGAGEWKYPAAGWISEAEAIEKARTALEEKGYSPEGLYPAVYSTAENQEEEYYIIYFDALTIDPDGAVGADPVYCVVLDARTGEVISCGENHSNG